MPEFKLYQGDCLEILPTLEAGSVDAVITDPPYGTTACAWDSVIPFEPMWAGIKRVLKERGAAVLFGSQPFTSALVMSNPGWFKYELVWIKSKPNGWQHAKNRPMKANEDVLVFSPAPMGHESLLGDKRMTYNPEGIRSIGQKKVSAVKHGRTMGKRPNQVGVVYEAFTDFPSNVLKYQNIIGDNAIHPTQKPVALMQYLVNTYTSPGDTVLDFTMGSGTTGVACMRTGRNFIGIELDPDYFRIAEQRIKNAAGEIVITDRERATGQLSLFDVEKPGKV